MIAMKDVLLGFAGFVATAALILMRDGVTLI